MIPRSLLVALAFAVPAVAQEGRVLTYPDLLGWTTDLERLTRPPEEGARCVQFSSFDRASLAGKDESEEWFANHDAGNYLRVEERNGAQEHVMVDAAGPGAVVRIWSANPKGRLRFYIDGVEEPTWAVDFAALTSGEVGPITGPLAGVRARGANCHLPIPFTERLVVSCTEGGFYYQVNVRHFPEGTEVPSWTPALLESHAAEIEAVRERLAAPWNLEAPGVPAGTDHRVTLALDRARTETVDAAAIAPREGGDPRPCTVRLFGARLEVLDDSDPAELARRILVVMRFGDEETVRVPLSDFFAAGTDLKPYRTYAMQLGNDGWALSRWPMPAPEGCQLGIDVGGEDVVLPCRVELVARTTAPPDDGGSLRFHASWHFDPAVPTRPFRDWTVLDAEGRGRLVGCSLSILNPVKSWWGEGDEKIRVDGEEFPSTFGTGTEDYFGYAWCCNEVFESAFHAQPQCDGPGNFGSTAVARWHLADAIPFQERLHFAMELWHWAEDVEVAYGTTAYWYATPGAHSGLPPVPDAGTRAIVRPQAPEMLIVEDALEGEHLEVAEKTGGEVERQDLFGFAAETWSRDRHLWWRDATPGDRLVLEVPLPAPGRYHLRAVMTRARDYGIAQASWNGETLGEPIDFYGEEVVPTEVLDLGEVSVGEDRVGRLGFTITGRNEQAIARYMIGLDYLLLERIE